MEVFVIMKSDVWEEAEKPEREPKKDLPKSIKSSATRLSQQPQIQNWLLIGMKVNRSSNCGESGTQLRIRMHER